MKVTLNLAGKETEIEVTRQGDTFTVVRDGQTYEAKLMSQDGHAFVLAYTDGEGKPHQIRAAGFAAVDRRQLWVNGQTHHYQRVRETGGDAGAAGSLAATIPAVVAEVLVAVGDEVAAGNKLILLESMKMVIPIQAPTAGIVTAIHCQAGDSVQPGVPLVELDSGE
ncbi:MAG TPA: biotin/lipoyl-containing protein [Anaerolineae bacterium]|nr:biotin/lipoyl-containing protein [Anaerolineae bacterium]